MYIERVFIQQIGKFKVSVDLDRLKIFELCSMSCGFQSARVISLVELDKIS